MGIGQNSVRAAAVSICRLFKNITPVGADVKGGEAVHCALDIWARRCYSDAAARIGGVCSRWSPEGPGELPSIQGTAPASFSSDSSGPGTGTAWAPLHAGGYQDSPRNIVNPPASIGGGKRQCFSDILTNL